MSMKHTKRKKEMGKKMDPGRVRLGKKMDRLEEYTSLPPHPTIIPYLTLPLVEGGGPKFYKLAYLKQCLQLKIRTKNVKNQTKIGPNFSEKSD